MGEKRLELKQCKNVHMHICNYTYVLYIKQNIMNQAMSFVIFVMLFLLPESSGHRRWWNFGPGDFSVLFFKRSVCRHVGPFRGDCNHHVLHTCIGHRSYRELWWASEAGGGQDDSNNLRSQHGGIWAYGTFNMFMLLGKLRHVRSR